MILFENGAVGLDLARCIAAHDDPQIVTEAHTNWSKGWLAEITLGDEFSKYDLERTFLNNGDKSKLSRAGNGCIWYPLPSDGFYEADSVWRSYQRHRVYFEIRDRKVLWATASKEEAKVKMQGKPADEAP